MRWIAIIGGILILLIAILVAVPFLIPTDVYRDKLVGLVKAQTGRDLVIGGDVSLSFFPSLAVSLSDARFANAAWGKESDMAAMKELRAAVKIMPLIRGEVEVDSFVMVDPVIHLEVKADGTPNWQFSPQIDNPAASADSAEPAQTSPPSETPPAAGTQDESPAGRLRQIRLGEIEIKNGTATYDNAQTGQSLAINEINLALSLPSLDDPFQADGSLIWNGEKIDLSLAAERPRAFSEGGDTPVEVSVTSAPLNVSYKGMIHPLDAFGFEGATELSIPSLRGLAAWLGSPLEPGNGFGALKLAGRASGKGATYVFSEAKVSLDGMNATGDLAVQTGGARPLISGKLAVDKIDTNIYMNAGLAPNPAGNTNAPPVGTAPAPVAPAAPVVSSSSGSSGGSGEGWNNEPIDMSGLRAVDARFSFSTEELLIKKIQIGASALTLKIDNGVLTANLTRLGLYEGSGSGVLTLNGQGKTPALSASFAISGVSAAPFLADAMDFTRLEGKTNLDLAVTTHGRSQREMVGALNGKGQVRFTNGAIKGINVAQLFRTVFQSPATGWQSGGSQDTDFSELGGTFTIANGILTNNDLKLLSPLLRVNGAGTVDLPKQRLQYRVDPKIVASLEGQGGSEAKGINIPVLVEGPWSQPRFRPDLESMLKNKEQTIETIKSLKDGGAKQILNNLLGGGQQESGAEEEGETRKPSPADALKSLFGR